MKNNYFFSIIMLSLFVYAGIYSTSAQTLDWVRTTGSYYKQGVMIARDANDNVVSCGYLIHDRIFTRKWDKFGNFLWEKEDTSGIFNYRERPAWIATDNSANIITLGYRYYGTSYQQPNAIVVLKYAPNGTLLFKDTIVGVFGTALRCELDSLGNIYIGAAATITGQPDFGFNLIKLDPNGNILFISTHNFGSYFSVNNMRYRNGKIALTGISSLLGFSFETTTALFDSSGNYLWGDNSTIGYAGIDVEVDNSGNVYMVNLDYGTGTGQDIKVTKYSVTGAVLFTYFYDNNGHDESPSRINLQSDGNLVISGVSTTPSTGIETFKLSSSGALMWDAFYETPSPDIPTLNFLATNMNTNEIFLTGTTSISGNPAHIFTINYDSLGNQSWAALYDSTATRGMGLAIASDGSVFVVGLNWWTVLHYGTDYNATRFSVVVRNFEFSPSNLPMVKLGDTIHFEWENGTHTTTSTTIPAGAAAWDNPIDASHLTFDYIPTTVGVYHYKCTPHEALGMVGQFTVQSVTGTQENGRIPKITMYPNPVRDRVYLNCILHEGIFIQHLTIYDITGKIIREESFNERSTFPDYLDLSAVPEGLIVFEFIDNLNKCYILRAVRKK